MKRTLTSYTLVAVMAMLLNTAWANSVSAWHEDLQRVGDGRLSWFGFTIYQATLYAPDGRYSADQEHVLEIVYQKSFSREELADYSVQEIERLYGPLENRELTVEQLSAVLCDVEPNMSISSRHSPGVGATFRCNGGLEHTLSDPDLARSFFSIWLHPDARKSDLRRQLLGMTE